MSHLLAPSLLSADFGNLQRDIEMINNSQADWFHLDIMDGIFVPNISFGFPIMKYIKKHAEKPLDVHLMIVDPDRYVDRFIKEGADYLTVHYEACTHLHRTVQNIKANGAKAGVSLNPHTPISVLEDILPELDMVLIMSVNPGFGGQKFIEQSYKKVAQLKQMINEIGSKCLIEIDGGVALNNYKKLKETGVNVFVAGNTVFGADDPVKMIAELKK